MAKDTKVTVVDDEQAQHAVERLQKLDRVLDIHLPSQVSEIWNYAVQLENEASINLAKRGFVYLMLQEQLPHGQFKIDLESKGIKYRSVNNAMNVAKMLATLPSSKVQTFALLNGSKLIELARIPLESLEDLEASGDLNIDEIDQMSVRELKQHLRDAKLNAKKSDMEKQLLEDQIYDIQADKKESKSEWPASVARARLESTTLSQQALSHIDNIELLLEQVKNDDNLDVDGQLNTNIGVTASTVYLNLKAIFVKAGRVLEQMQTDFDPAYLPKDEKIDFTPLSSEEASLAAAHLKLLFDLDETNAESREAFRQMNGDIKKGKGRPFGSKNKSKEQK